MEGIQRVGRPRSSSLPSSPERVPGNRRSPELVSPVGIDRGLSSGSSFASSSSAPRTELVWCAKRETLAEAYPAIRHAHEGTGRQGLFLLGKSNPGQLLMLPEAEELWEITPFGQSWTQAARVVPPVVGYPEPFVSALLQVILEGRLINGDRLSWSRWLQHYPLAPSQVYALMPCRACNIVRRLPLFSLMTAPSESATFTCASASRQCETPHGDVCP